jgi:hypothetical protein
MALDADTLLIERTGHGRAYWFARVQSLILEHSTEVPAKELRKMGLSPGHFQTDTSAWISALSQEVIDSAPSEPHDGNMYAASMLGLILALWFTRLQRAKCCDPVRPLGIRRKAYSLFLDYTHALFGVCVDEREDAIYLPSQQWQSPFVPKAKSGSYK